MPYFLQRTLGAIVCVLWLVVTIGAAQPVNPAAGNKPLALTAEEQGWINSHPVIRVITLDDYAPYLFTKPNGQLVGLSIDLLDLIARRTGLKFEYNAYKSVTLAMAAFKSGGGDLLPAVARSPEREQFILYSQPYSTAFAVIVTRVDSPYLNELQDLNGLRVGTLHGALQKEAILSVAPNCHLVEYTSVEESLVGLASGQVDATYASVGIAAYYIKNRQLSNLRLGSVVGQPNNLHIGVRKDWPILAGIIDKAVADITPAERKTLDDRWIFVAESPSRWLAILRFVIGVAVVATAVSLLLFFFYRRLQRELNERRRIQGELEAAHARLARVSEEKSEMMSSIAHDLRNPITGIMLGGELLTTVVDPRNREAHDMIAAQKNACRKILSMVDELVTTHVLESGRRELKWERIDLVTVAGELIAEMTEAASRKGITLHFSPELPQMPLLSDDSALRQVVDNLVSNAIKYSPHRSGVIVDLRRQDQGYLLRVIDQGPGVRPEERETIFERFQRGSAPPTGNEKSTGLGLWIVRRTLTDLHGRVWCEPNPASTGTIFSVYVPLEPAQA